MNSELNIAHCINICIILFYFEIIIHTYVKENSKLLLNKTFEI